MAGWRYILDGKTPRRCDDLMEWARWFQTADRSVAHSTIGNASISTVFLGLDHSFARGGPPVLFETLVFGGPHDGHMERCSTWAEAELQHRHVVALLSHAYQ